MSEKSKALLSRKMFIGHTLTGKGMRFWEVKLSEEPLALFYGKIFLQIHNNSKSEDNLKVILSEKFMPLFSSKMFDGYTVKVNMKRI